MKYKANTNKYSKHLTILLCVGVFAGLIYLSSLNRTKAEEFSKAVGQDIASIESKSSEETKVATLNNFRNHVAPVLKWNLDKEWEWKPFRAGSEVELKKIKNIEKSMMDDIHDVNARLREVIVAKEIFITVETHLLPDPRSSEEALDDFISFWRHQEPISDLIRMRLKYMASITPKFNEQEMQIIEEARRFFDDKRKMQAMRQKIGEAKSMDGLFNDDDKEALVSQFLRHLMQIHGIVYTNH